MSADEVALFESFLRKASRYVEFGSGGSTYLATARVKSSVTSVDSSREWLNKVEECCKRDQHPIVPTLIHVDIGPIASLGYPANNSKREEWNKYYNILWSDDKNRQADLYLVDGRFRVACFVQVVLNCQPDALIAIHDFESRPQYHVVREIAREVASARNMSIFIKKRDISRTRAREILAQHAYVAD